MRAFLLIAGAALALAACKNNDQSDKTQNFDENLTAESIVSNDVTAIDAVTGDAANMAADVDVNYGSLDVTGSNMPANESPRPATTGPKSSAPAERNTVTNATANSATNAE